MFLDVSHKVYHHRKNVKKIYNVYFIVIRLHSRDPVNCSDNWNSFLRNLVNINNVNCGKKRGENNLKYKTSFLVSNIF